MTPAPEPPPGDERRDHPTRPWVGIGCVIFDADRVLLVRRAKPPRAGAWSLPGGAQHLGETAEAAARRELLEETGIQAGPLILADVIDAITRDELGRAQFHYTIIDYAGRWRAGTALAADDVLDVAWAAPSALADYDLTPEALAVIAKSRALLARG
ncbi:MAG: NUDIX hydrolase [Pseudomonadota bacterium]